MRVRVFVIAALLLGVVVGPSTPAAATVTVVASGTTLTITMTADESVSFACIGGNTYVNAAPTSPTVACSALTQVTVNGNAENQSVQSSSLDFAGFTTGPKLVANMGDGNDTVSDTDQSDTIDMGPGNDFLLISAESVADVNLLGGPGNDQVNFGTARGTAATDTNIVSSSFILTFQNTANGVTRVFQPLDFETSVVSGGDATNDIDASGVTAGTTLTYVSLNGGDGNDTLRGGPLTTRMNGGVGTNTFLGGTGPDYIESWSPTDTISPGLGQNSIVDSFSASSGGRTLDIDGDDSWTLDHFPGDAAVRIRPGFPSAIVVTAALSRPGQQVLPNKVGSVNVRLAYNGEPNSRAIADVQALPGKDVSIVGDAQKDDLVDIVVPVGQWTGSGVAGENITIDPIDPSLGNVTVINLPSVRIHNPWTSANQGFAWRSVRDLLFRFYSTQELTAKTAELDGETLTRSQHVANLMNTDEYRGLDVDRTFLKYLDRVADPGGRTYWINSIRNGKALWRFRAQLFGSNEYFTKAGSTNASYVRAAYFDVLNRLPDPSGETYWTNKLNNGADRGAVALQFINSPEARRRLVDDQFLRFLARKPTTTEQTTWVNALPGATGEQSLIASLAASTTYYNSN